MTKFGEAFKAARKAGKKEFTFGGKKYNTKTKEEAAAPKPVKRSVKDKVRVPKGPQVAHTKGGNAGAKVKAKPSTAVADAKVRADAAREERIKKSKGSAANIGYAKRVTGRKAG